MNKLKTDKSLEFPPIDSTDFLILPAAVLKLSNVMGPLGYGPTVRWVHFIGTRLRSPFKTSPFRGYSQAVMSRMESWLYVATAQYRCILDPLKNALMKGDKTTYAYNKRRRVSLYAYINELHKHRPTTWITGTPILFRVLWFLLLFYPYI